jgi:hypothetical protein
MALVSEGWEMPHCLAARVKLRSSQSARKYRIWCISMPTPAASIALAYQAATDVGFGG